MDWYAEHDVSAAAGWVKKALPNAEIVSNTVADTGAGRHAGPALGDC